jgi:Uma2 family endonuclease
MPLFDSPSDYPLLREELRALQPPFLLRHYDATPEDYEQITDEDLKCEFIDGELIVHSPASFQHEDMASFVNAVLRSHVGHHVAGFVLGSNAVMQLGQRRFSPDVSVLLAEHADRIANKRVIGPLDLAVEILSTSTRKYDYETKLPLYREGRVREIWLIDPEKRQFEVHARKGDAYASQVLASGRWTSVAIPGLTIDVDWFWRDPLPSVLECRTDA